MIAVRAPFRHIALLLGALALCACEVGGPAEETEEENEPSTGKRDASTKADSGSKSADAGKKDGGRADAGRDSGRTIIDARVNTGEDPEPGDDDDGDDGGPSTGEPSADGGSTASVGADGGGGGGPKGEVITTEMGEKIYLDPSCTNLMPMIAGMSLDLVGCCLAESKKCGLSTHKLMIPAQFASMFPTKCRGYEELARLMVEAPAEKACSIEP